MSEPYVGNEPMGAAGAELAAAAGPAKYVVLESVTAEWLLTDGAAVDGGASTAGAVAGAVEAGTSETGG
jgi:hypothetical protein